MTALKLGISIACQENEEAAPILKSFNHGKTGKPQIEVDQPELLSGIVKIVEAAVLMIAVEQRFCVLSKHWMIREKNFSKWV